MPVDITCNLIRNAMIEAGWAEKKFLVDGFPRNQDNYDGWSRIMGDDVEIIYVLHFDCNEEELTKRIIERSASSGRADDNPEVFLKIFKQFDQEGMPIIEIFQKENKVKVINGFQDQDKVFEDVKATLAG